MSVEVENAIAGRRPNSEGWWRVNCPFCADRRGSRDKHNSLSVSVRGKYQCWRCEAEGRIEARDPSEVPPPPKFDDLPTGELPQGFVPLYAIRDHAPARPLWDWLVQYLTSARRNVDPEVAVKLGCGYVEAGADPRLGNVPRFVVPVHVGGRLLGWSARDLIDRHPAKYLNLPGMPTGRLLFGQDLIDAMPDEMPLVVTEGVFDALPHYPMSCALLGKPKNEQVDLLKRTSRPIVVAIDSDTDRLGEALVWALRLDGKRAFWLRLPPGLDPGKINKNDFRRLVVDAMLGQG